MFDDVLCDESPSFLHLYAVPVDYNHRLVQVMYVPFNASETKNFIILIYLSHYLIKFFIVNFLIKNKTIFYKLTSLLGSYMSSLI